MTEMQKQFEEWAKSVSHNMASSERADLPYLSYETQIAYEAWQASRAAIVVKLPSFFSDRYESEICFTDEVEKSLDDEGVSYE